MKFSAYLDSLLKETKAILKNWSWFWYVRSSWLQLI